MKLAVYTACLAFLGVSILLGGFGLALSRQIMEVLQTPADVLDMAVDYLNIYFAGLPFLFLYNVFSSMFNALGKSRIPLYFLIFSSVFNVVLDMVLVTKANMGVTGVAWATLIAQGISAVLSFLVLAAGTEAFPQRKNRHLQSHGTAANDTHCPALHFTAVHRFHWHDAGAVGDKQLRFRGIGWIFGGNAGGVHLHCAYGGVRQRSLLLHCPESGCRTGRTSGKRVSCHELHGTLQCYPDLRFAWNCWNARWSLCFWEQTAQKTAFLRRRGLSHFYGVVLLFHRF